MPRARPRGGSPTRSGRPRRARPRRTTSTTPTRAARVARAGRLRDVARIPRSRSCAWRPTCCSRTTPRSCSTTPCSTARSSSTRPTGRVPRPPRRRTSTCSPSRPGLVTRTEDEVVDGLRSAPSRRRRRARVPRALLRARGRPRRRARGAARVAGRARASAPRRRSPMSEHRLVLVVGVGRSGTSLLAGILGQLGFHIPQPEVQADDTNPRGLRRAALGGRLPHAAAGGRRVTRQRRAAGGVGADGARPRSRRSATSCATGCAGSSRRPSRSSSRTRARCWFLPLWRRCADELGARASFVTMLRHPAEIVASAAQLLRDWQTDGRPRRGVDQPDAGDGALDARRAARVRALRRPAGRLAARGPRGSARRSTARARGATRRARPAGRRVRRPDAAPQPRHVGRTSTCRRRCASWPSRCGDSAAGRTGGEPRPALDAARAAYAAALRRGRGDRAVARSRPREPIRKARRAQGRPRAAADVARAGRRAGSRRRTGGGCAKLVRRA